VKLDGAGTNWQNSGNLDIDGFLMIETGWWYFANLPVGLIQGSRALQRRPPTKSPQPNGAGGIGGLTTVSGNELQFPRLPRFPNHTVHGPTELAGH